MLRLNLMHEILINICISSFLARREYIQDSNIVPYNHIDVSYNHINIVLDTY